MDSKVGASRAGESARSLNLRRRRHSSWRPPRCACALPACAGGSDMALDRALGKDERPCDVAVARPWATSSSTSRSRAVSPCGSARSRASGHEARAVRARRELGRRRGPPPAIRAARVPRRPRARPRHRRRARKLRPRSCSRGPAIPLVPLPVAAQLGRIPLGQPRRQLDTAPRTSRPHRELACDLGRAADRLERKRCLCVLATVATSPSSQAISARTERRNASRYPSGCPTSGPSVLSSNARPPGRPRRAARSPSSASVSAPSTTLAWERPRAGLRPRRSASGRAAASRRSV